MSYHSEEDQTADPAIRTVTTLFWISKANQASHAVKFMSVLSPMLHMIQAPAACSQTQQLINLSPVCLLLTL